MSFSCEFYEKCYDYGIKYNTLIGPESIPFLFNKQFDDLTEAEHETFHAVCEDLKHILSFEVLSDDS